MVVSTTTVGGFVMSREIRHKASTKMCLPGGGFVKMISILLLNKWRQTIFNQQNAPAFGDVRKWLLSGS